MRVVNFSFLYRALDAYDAAEGIFDPTQPSMAATRAWRWVERAALVAGIEASAALHNAEMIDDDGRLTPKGVELLKVQPKLTLEQILSIKPA